MSTAAINSASGHRTGPNKKKAKVNLPVGISATQSLLNDESILSQQHTSKGINHSSLIVDSTNHRMTGDISILS